MSELNEFENVYKNDAQAVEDNFQTDQTQTPEARWYGVTYQTNYSPLPEVKPRRRIKLALVALVLAVMVLVSTLAFVGGYFINELLDHVNDTDLDNDGDHPEVVLPSSPSSGTNMGTVYTNEGATTYNYPGVALPKNDGTGLTGHANGSAGDGALTRIAAVAAVRNSVVEITTTTVSNRGQLVAGAGSGVIVHADGIIVTNNHVIEGASHIYVRLTNGNTYEAYLRGTDEETDIAILKIMPQETLTVAKLGSSASLCYGEDVFAIGNPLGELGGTVTEGVISALEREVEMSDGVVMTLLQTSAAINSGNSGGGLFNMAGELIGVVNAKYSASGVEGLGFAIPIDTAVQSIRSLLDYGYIQGLPSLGATIVDSTMQVSFFQYVNLPYVYAVKDSNSPLQAGDWIYKIDDTVVSTASALKRVVRTYEIGDTVTLTIYRNNQQTTVSVTLVEYIPENSSVSFN